MHAFSFMRLAAVAAAALSALACAASASAQAQPPGLGDQLFSTGGEITVEVLRSRAVYTSELRLYAADGSFTAIAVNRESGRAVTLPARPKDEELVFGIFVRNTGRTYKLGPGDRNPDGIAHAVVTKTGDREFVVGFEDLHNGGDRSYNDNAFRFTGGLAPNRSPTADDQSLTVAQGGSLPIALSAMDPDGDALTFSVPAAPLHGTLAGTGAALTYTPQAGFVGLDTFGFEAADGVSAAAEGRVTIDVTAAVVTPGDGMPGGTTGSGSPPVRLPDCVGGELTLLEVRQVGSRTLLTGLAERTLAGAPVEIVEGGVVVARTTIAIDGSFRVRVAIPRNRGGRVLRYQARLGNLRSRNVRLQRRMVTTSARLRSRRIVFTGRVANPPRRVRPLVHLIARPRGCGTRTTIVASARLRPGGTFRLSAPPLAGVDVAVYQARVKLPGTITYSLPQTIAHR